LVRIAETYDCAAIATNQVMASPDVFFGDPTRPIGGNVVAHTSTYRIYFKKSGKKRIARMVDSPHHPEEEVIFALGEAGVIDPEEAEKKPKKAAKKVTTKKTKEPKVEATVEPKVEATVEPKVEATVEPKVEATVEPKVETLEDHGADITSDDF
jgi:DNA repair protein RadA